MPRTSVKTIAPRRPKGQQGPLTRMATHIVALTGRAKAAETANADLVRRLEALESRLAALENRR